MVPCEESLLFHVATYWAGIRVFSLVQRREKHLSRFPCIFHLVCKSPAPNGNGSKTPAPNKWQACCMCVCACGECVWSVETMGGRKSYPPDALALDLRPTLVCNPLAFFHSIYFFSKSAQDIAVLWAQAAYVGGDPESAVREWDKERKVCSSEGRLQLWATWVHPIGSAVGWERAGLSKLVWKEPHSKFCQGCGPLNSSSPCSTNIIIGSMYHMATHGFLIKLSFF